MIRVYLRQGLLPEPHRPKPNVAEYSEKHVKGTMAIRVLQHQRHLSLPQIKRAMAGALGTPMVDPRAFQHLDSLVAARLGVEDVLVPVSTLLTRSPKARTDARALARIGAIRLHSKGGKPHLTPGDARIVSIWGDMRAAGYTESTGILPEITRVYVEAADALAREEVSNFFAATAGRVDEARAAEMVQSAMDLMLSFFGLLRTKAVLEALARRAGGVRKPVSKTKSKRRLASPTTVD